MGSPQSTASKVLTVVGLVLVIGVGLKAVTGFYRQDALWMLPLLAVGGVCLWLGRRSD
ncbi:hypothetical protein GCM10027596_28770 [Nocardioides korecus]